MENIEEKIIHKSHSQSKQIRALGRSQNSCQLLKPIDSKPKSKMFSLNKSRLRTSESKMKSIDTSPLRNTSKRNGNLEHPVLSNYSSPLNVLRSKDSKKPTTSKGPKHEKHRKKSKKRELDENALKTEENFEESAKLKLKDKDCGRRCSAEIIKPLFSTKLKHINSPNQCLDISEKQRPDTTDLKKVKKPETIQFKKPSKKLYQEKPAIIQKKGLDSHIQTFMKERKRKKSLEKSIKRQQDDKKEQERILSLISLEKHRKLSKSKKKNNKGKIVKEKFIGFKTMRKKKSKFEVEGKSLSKDRRKTPKLENFRSSSSSSESFLSSELRTERDDWINTWSREYKGPASEFVEEFKVKLQNNAVRVPKMQEIAEKLTESSKKSSSVFSEFGETMSKPKHGLIGSLGSSIKPNVPPLSLSLLKNEDFDSEDDEYIINKDSPEDSAIESSQSSQNEDYSKTESENNTQWIFDFNSGQSIISEEIKEVEKLKKTVSAFKNLDIKKVQKHNFEESLDGSVNLNELISLKSPRKGYKPGPNNVKNEILQGSSGVEEKFKDELETENQEFEVNGESSEESLGNSGDSSENYHGYSSSCEENDENFSEEKSYNCSESNLHDRLKETPELVEYKEELIKIQENSFNNIPLINQKKELSELLISKNREICKSAKLDDSEEPNVANFENSEKISKVNLLSKGLFGIEKIPQKLAPIDQITKMEVEDNLVKQVCRPTLIPSPKELFKPSPRAEEIHKSLKPKELNQPTVQKANQDTEKNLILNKNPEKLEQRSEKNLKITQNSEKISILPKNSSNPIKNPEKISNLIQTPEKVRISIQIQEKIEIININPKNKIPTTEPLPLNPEPDKSNVSKKHLTKKLNPIITKNPSQIPKKTFSEDDPEQSIQPICEEKYIIETPTSSENLFTPIENTKITKIKASFVPDFTKLEEFKYEERRSENSILGYDMLQTSLIMPNENRSIDATIESVSPMSVNSPKYTGSRKGFIEDSENKWKISPKGFEKNEKFLTSFKEHKTKVEPSRMIFSSKFLENLGELSSDRSKKFSDSARNLIKYAQAIEKTGGNTKIEYDTQISEAIHEEILKGKYEVIGTKVEKVRDELKISEIPGNLEVTEKKPENLEITEKKPEKTPINAKQSVKIPEKNRIIKDNPLKTTQPKSPEDPKKLEPLQRSIINKTPENSEKTLIQLLNPDQNPNTSEEFPVIPSVTPILSKPIKPEPVSNFTSDLFKSYNPFTDSSSSDIDLSKSYESSPALSPAPSSFPSLLNEDWSAELSSLVNSEISSYLRIISFKDSEKEVDPSLDYIMEYLNTMANELKENEFEVLEAINTPVYQEPLSRLSTFQDPKTPILSKFPTLELILPPDLCSELKVRFESLELPSRQIYLQMLFDCVNEALNYIRPFGVTGIPDPWSTHPRILFGEAELENVFNRIVNYMVKWGSSRSGTYPCSESSQDDDRLTALREEKMSSLLCVDIKDEESNWTYYEEEETQTKILVGNSIFSCLIDEIFIIIRN